MQAPGAAASPVAGASSEELDFSGDYSRTIDDKGRIVIPPGFRPALSTGGFLRSWPGPCVGLWTPGAFRDIDAQLRQRRRENLGNPNARRALYAGAPRVALDAQGRLFLPEKMRAWAGIEAEVVVAGVGDYIEIWDAQRWRSTFEDGEIALFDEIQTGLGY